jgi:hypothetical protein
MLFVGTLTYLKSKRLLFNVFYNGTFLIMQIIIVFNMNIYIYIRRCDYTYWMFILSKLYQLPCFFVYLCVCFVSCFWSCLLHNWPLGYWASN